MSPEQEFSLQWLSDYYYVLNSVLVKSTICCIFEDDLGRVQFCKIIPSGTIYFNRQCVLCPSHVFYESHKVKPKFFSRNPNNLKRGPIL